MAAMLWPGPPRQIFGRQDRHSSGHIAGAPQAHQRAFYFANSRQDLELAVLPPVAALMAVMIWQV